MKIMLISHIVHRLPFVFCCLPLFSIGLILSSCGTTDTRLDRKYYDLVVSEQRNYVELDTARLNSLAIEHVIEGSKLQQQNKFAESILEFQEALKYDSSSSIMYAIAKSSLMLGRYESAFKNVINALNKEPHFVPAMELLTELYVYKNNIKDAITVYRSIYDLQPSRIKRSYLARLYEYDNIDSAIYIYEQLLNQKEEPELLYRIAKLYDKKSDTVRMIQTYESLVKYSPNKFDAFHALLRTYLERNDYTKAFQILDTIRLNFTDEDINYFYNLTGNFLLEDSNDLTLDYIPKLLKFVENNFYFDWRNNMIAGYLSHKIKDSVLVERFFERAMKADTLSDIFLAVSFHYLRNGNHQKALQILNDNEFRFPESFAFPLYRGIVLQDLDSMDLALGQYYLALGKDTNNIEVWSQIGLVYDHVKNYDSCDIAYLRVLSLEPDNALINNNYAYSLAVRGEKLDTALIMSKKSLKYEPENPSYLDTYGWIQYKMGNYELALDYILRSIDANGENAEVLEHLGFVYLKLGRKSEAKESFEKALGFEPENEEIKKQIEFLNSEQ